MPAPKRIEAAVVISDLHVWSTVGLWPEGDFMTLAGNYVGQNPFQKWLWKHWLDVWQKQIPALLGKTPFLLVVNGDIVEGRHHRSDQVMTGSEDDQMEALLKVMEPAVKNAAKIIVTKGTECHTRNLENHAARMLGAIPDPNTGHAAWDKAVFTIKGCRCVARHHMPCTTRPWSETNGPRTVLMSERLEAVKNGEPVPDVVLTAHRHVYGEDRSMHGLAVVTPAWQGLTRHGYKVVPQSHGVNPGVVVLDWRGLPEGSLPRSELLVKKSSPIQSISL